MAKRRGWIVAPAAAALLLAACEHIPYYDESLNWFSWSEYDPEVKAIEADIPPPGALGDPVAPDGRTAFVGDGRGGYVHANPPPGAEVSLGAKPFASGSGVAAAGKANVGGSSSRGAADAGSPLVGTRNSVGGSVTWRSPRGTP